MKSELFIAFRTREAFKIISKVVEDTFRNEARTRSSLLQGNDPDCLLYGVEDSYNFCNALLQYDASRTGLRHFQNRFYSCPRWV